MRGMVFLVDIQLIRSQLTVNPSLRGYLTKYDCSSADVSTFSYHTRPQN